MTAYSELVKKFREKNSKPKTDWKYESWGNPKVERLAVFTKPQFGTQDTYGAPEEIPIRSKEVKDSSSTISGRLATALTLLSVG